MYGYMRVRLPMIRNYKEALAHEDAVKPVRGTTIKPIGLRRNKHMQILKKDENIICRLYQTDVVTYKPDGEIVVNINSWVSNTTVGFLVDLLDECFYIFDHRMWVRTKHEGEVKVFPLRSDEDNIFTRTTDGSNRLVLKDPPTTKIHKVNRKQANKVRKECKDFKDYAQQVFKLRQDENNRVAINDEELQAMFGKKPSHLVYGRGRSLSKETEVSIKSLISSTDTADRYKAFLWVAVSTRSYLYWHATVEGEFMRIFDDLVMYLHRDEIFVEVEYVGEQKRDSYGRFF